jgi:signal transduction histidine kinase
MTSTPLDPAGLVPGDEPAATGRGGRVIAGVRAGTEAVHRVLTRPDGPLALALLLGGVAFIEVSLYRGGSHRELAILLNLGATLPLALAPKRLWLAAPAITGTWMILATQAEPLYTVGAVGGQLAVAYLVAWRYRRWASVALALPFALFAILTPDVGHDSSLSGTLLLVLVVAAQVLGDAQRQRDRTAAEREASRLAVAESRRDQAVMEERARIARELHDVVAHHISMIAVQAETARLTTPGMPDEGRSRLVAIGDTARDALDEMRRLLDVLRARDGSAPERAPQPGLARLDALVEAARASGMEVRLSVEGPSVPLPPGVDLTAYRIVQEALTNARVHAPGAAVDVAVRYGDGVLHLRVHDDGPGPPAATGAPGGHAGHEGHGLVGMRERAAMLGGRLQAGPGAGTEGGFTVEADLPFGGTRT